MFLIDVIYYRKISSSNIKIKSRLGKCIFDEFIEENSPNQVNISTTLREKCAQIIFSSQSDESKYTNELFGDIEDEVIKLIDQNMMMSFINSEQYQLCLSILSAPRHSSQFSYTFSSKRFAFLDNFEPKSGYGFQGRSSIHEVASQRRVGSVTASKRNN